MHKPLKIDPEERLEKAVKARKAFIKEAYLGVADISLTLP